MASRCASAIAAVSGLLSNSSSMVYGEDEVPNQGALKMTGREERRLVFMGPWSNKCKRGTRALTEGTEERDWRPSLTGSGRVLFGSPMANPNSSSTKSRNTLGVEEECLETKCEKM